jgi:dodecin
LSGRNGFGHPEGWPRNTVKGSGSLNSNSTLRLIVFSHDLDVSPIHPGRQGLTKRRVTMSDHVYRIIEIAGSSEKSIEDAIQTAVGRASRTLRQVGWFEVVQTRGHVENGKVAHYQVILKIGFTLEDSA